jgi:hypothetical protein
MITKHHIFKFLIFFCEICESTILKRTKKIHLLSRALIFFNTTNVAQEMCYGEILKFTPGDFHEAFTVYSIFCIFDATIVVYRVFMFFFQELHQQNFFVTSNALSKDRIEKILGRNVCFFLRFFFRFLLSVLRFIHVIIII